MKNGNNWKAYLPTPEIFEDEGWFGYRVWKQGVDGRVEAAFLESGAVFLTADRARMAAEEKMLKSDWLVGCAKYDYQQHLAYKRAMQIGRHPELAMANEVGDDLRDI